MAPPRVSAFKPEQLWQQAREPLFWLDQTLRLNWVNHAWEALTGCPAASVIGHVCTPSGPTGPGGEQADLAACFVPPPEAIAGKPTGCRTIIVHASGERLWRRIEFWPFRDRNGALLGLLGQVRDAAEPPREPDSQAYQLRVQLMELRERLRQAFGLESLIGTGPAHQRLIEQVRLAAASTVPVLLIGEPGTGKRFVARTIHAQSPRRERPFVLFDCEALPAEVLERELFTPRIQPEAAGDETHALAHEDMSKLALAEGSSLSIGDILALPRDLQTRLAGSLDDRVRVIATTSGDPEAAVSQEKLRPELHCALTVLVIRLLPLRDRRGDLLLLAQQFLERANHRTGATCGGFTPQALSALESYDWPGNLRELGRVIDTAVAQLQAQKQAENGMPLIDASDLPASILGHLGAAYLPPSAPRPVQPLDELLTEIERRLIENALARSRQNKSRAAELLGISRPRLYRRIKELNLPDDAEAEPEVVPAAAAPTEGVRDL
ncbi:MAG: sigma 54-interacting transcriptional regulator [Isosphaeraceae bacterium]